MYRIGQLILIAAFLLITVMGILLIFNLVDSRIAGVGIIIGLPLTGAGNSISKKYRNAK